MQYEYKITDVYDPTTHYLNQYGQDGWELVGVLQGVHGGYSMTRTVMYWKRRLPGDFVEPHKDPVEPIKPSPEIKPNTRSWRDDVIDEHFGRKSGQLEHNAVLEACGISRDYGGQEHSAVMEAIGHC